MSDINVMLFTRRRRRRYGAIPVPNKDLDSLYEAVMALKETVELMAGQRQDPRKEETQVVAFEDLIDLGIIERDKVRGYLYDPRR